MQVILKDPYDGMTTPDPVFTFYEDINYKGKSYTVTFPEGRIQNLKYLANKVSSIKAQNVTRNYILYSGTNGSGTYVTLKSGVSNLLNYGFNDLLSSIKVPSLTETLNWYVDFFTEENYTGTKFRTYYLESLGTILNEDISSVKVNGYFIVVLQKTLDPRSEFTIVDNKNWF